MKKLNIGPAVKRNTMQEEALNRLKEVILSGQLSPDAFYTENDFAEALQISRTPVREAVKSLIHDGLLVSVPRKGLKVREFTRSEVEQIFLLRQKIEGSILEKVSSTITEDQLKTLNKIVAEQENAIEKDDRILFIDLDQEFHNFLIRVTEYDLIEEMIMNLHNLTRLIGHRAIMKQGRMEEVIDEHRAIIQALSKKDAPLAQLKMTFHLEQTEHSFQMMDPHGQA